MMQNRFPLEIAKPVTHEIHLIKVAVYQQYNKKNVWQHFIFIHDMVEMLLHHNDYVKQIVVRLYNDASVTSV